MSLCQWFIEIKLSIHFEEDKTKSILFSKKRGLREINILCILSIIAEGAKVDNSGDKLWPMPHDRERIWFLNPLGGLAEKADFRILCRPEYADHWLWNEKIWKRGLSLKVDKIYLT